MGMHKASVLLLAACAALVSCGGSLGRAEEARPPHPVEALRGPAPAAPVLDRTASVSAPLSFVGRPSPQAAEIAVASTGAARGPSPVQAHHSATASRLVAGSELCVSAGRVNPLASHLHVDSGGMRAVVAGDVSSAAELEFTYRGPSAETAPLASGELRRQIGLKLRAKDTCNVVYVMWHLEPTPGIAVSVKSNPGASTHQQCGDHGYINLRPTTSALVAPILRDEAHALRAEIQGDVLRVLADGVVVWAGALPPQAFAFDGPAGIRSDNGAFDFDIRVPHLRATAARCAAH